jgi:hypothetical protein
VPVSTIPEVSKENLTQEIPLTEDAPNKVTQEEQSTANSSPKGNVKGPQQDSPRIEKSDKADEDPQEGKDTIAEGNLAVIDSAFDGEPQQQRQDQSPNHTEEPSNQKPPSSDDAGVEHYFESSNEEDISAEPGGSSVDPQSSTSKISAAAGIPESLLQGLDVSTPEEALEKLLSGGSFNTNSEGTSAPAENNEAARLEQAHLEARFIEEFLHRDVLDVIDSNPNAFFSLKAQLQQLQTDRTKEAMLFLVNQAEAHIDQFAKNQQLLINAQKSYQAQMHAHASVLADANACKAEVGNLRSGVTAAYLKAAACEDNIAKWKAEIRELEAKVTEEERLQKYYVELATEVSPAQIEAKANEGLRLCSNAAALQATAQRIDKDSNLLKLKLSQLKELYRAFQRSSLGHV